MAVTTSFLSCCCFSILVDKALSFVSNWFNRSSSCLDANISTHGKRKDGTEVETELQHSSVYLPQSLPEFQLSLWVRKAPPRGRMALSHTPPRSKEDPAFRKFSRHALACRSTSSLSSAALRYDAVSILSLLRSYTASSKARTFSAVASRMVRLSCLSSMSLAARSCQ